MGATLYQDFLIDYLLPLERKTGYHNLIRIDTFETAAWNINISTDLPLDVVTFSLLGHRGTGKWSEQKAACPPLAFSPCSAGGGVPDLSHT